MGEEPGPPSTDSGTAWNTAQRRAGSGGVHSPADAARTLSGSSSASPSGSSSEREALFAEHVLPHLPVLYRVALSLAGQPADAEDLVQETLIRVYRAVDRFDGAHPRAWLLTILRHTHLNRVRVRTPDLLRDGEDAAAERMLWSAGTAHPSAEDVVVGELFEHVVAQAMAGLPDKHRLVVTLVDVDGLTYAEAAQVLGVPRGTVMSRLHRARARIRGRLVAAGLVGTGRLS